MTAPLLDVRGLSRDFEVRKGLFAKSSQLTAARDVTFQLDRGEILGIVGESGSGKTTVGRMLMRLTEPTSGSVAVEGTDILRLSHRDMLPFRRKMQMIFQDPNSSLNPRMTAGAQIEEAMTIHRIGSQETRGRRVAELIEQVGLPADTAGRYPHEFSGGQKQRIGIARALAVEPSILVADESVSALDVSVQAQILNMLLDLRDSMGLAIIFISHDLSVVEYFADRVIVMYLGHVVETAASSALFKDAAHPYTRALIDAAPRPNPDAPKTRELIRGDLTSAIDLPPGCVYRKRCPIAIDACAEGTIPLEAIASNHACACLRARE